MSESKESGFFQDGPTPSSSFFFLCDIQEVFRTRVEGMEELIANAKFMTQAAGVMDIPVIATEQLPFRKTVTELAELSGMKQWQLFEKTRFSMCCEDVVEVLQKPENKDRRNVYIYGIEAHVCVLQTAVDLHKNGYSVYVVVDSVSSQRRIDRSVALERLAQVGCTMTTAESAVYELIGDAKNPKFKELLPYVKEMGNARRKLKPSGKL